MLCLLHGWLLEGSGSNLWTRAVVRALCRRGETVHLLCQENHPDRYDFIAKSISYGLDGSERTTFSRETSLPGKCILHKPDLGETLPVFVWDKYEEYQRVVPMIDLSTDEIESYIGINSRVLRRLIEDHGVTAVHANHAVMMPVVAQRLRESHGVRYTVMPHGSDIEYAVKKDARFLGYASAALVEASRVFVIGDEMRDRVLKVFAAVPRLEQKLTPLHLGVDTSDFELVEREDRAGEIAKLAAQLEKLPSGKSARLESGMTAALPGVRDLPSLRGILGDAAAYDGKRPDEAASRKLSAVEWGHVPTLLFVGRLIAWKGIQSVIAALPPALAANPTLKTIIVGHGPLREAMEAMVWALRVGRRDIVEMIVASGRLIDGSVEHGGDESLSDVRRFYQALETRGELDEYFSLAQRVMSEDSVMFTGYLTHSELKHLFPCCDAGVFPSVVREAGPLVFLEALASGCFPLGTYFGGMKASIDSVSEELPAEVSEIMKLDPANTVAELARKIPLALRESGSYREALSRIAREKYDWGSVSEKFLRETRALQ